MNNFISRNEKGSLRMNMLNLEIFMLDLFEEAKTEEEIEWIHEELSSLVDYASDISTEELEED